MQQKKHILKRTHIHTINRCKQHVIGVLNRRNPYKINQSWSLISNADDTEKIIFFFYHSTDRWTPFLNKWTANNVRFCLYGKMKATKNRLSQVNVFFMLFIRIINIQQLMLHFRKCFEMPNHSVTKWIFCVWYFVGPHAEFPQFGRWYISYTISSKMI